MEEDLIALYRCLEPVACAPSESRGRLYLEPKPATRSEFQRDRDRIIHCSAFRRLKYKTQVFVYHEGDNYRTRLTHSLEVAQIARSVSRYLGLDEDLAEALALAHDLGHTCFGHTGEDALQACMTAYNGFDHNAQALRIVTKLEQRYPEFDGLNLTWECLEGLVKHNGPLKGSEYDKPLPLAIAEYAESHDLELDRFASAEAQVAAVADDIAYNAHDIDDGLHAGLFDVGQLAEVPLVGPIIHDVRRRYPGLSPARSVHEIVRQLIGAMVNDVIAEAGRRFKALTPATAEEVRDLGQALIGFSPAMAENDKALKGFLFPNMYRHARVAKTRTKAKQVVEDLFQYLLTQPDHLPEEWSHNLDGPGGLKTARRVADYIAGMTDRFALAQHAALFGTDSDQ